MRSTIDIDESLIKRAMSLSKARSKKEVINMSLQCFVRDLMRESLKNNFGKMNLDLTMEDLEKIRSED